MDVTFSMNRKSPRQAKRVESAADVSYGIASVLRYVKTTTATAKHLSGCGRSYVPKNRRHVVVLFLEQQIDRPFSAVRMCAQLTGKHLVIRHIVESKRGCQDNNTTTLIP